MENDNLAEYRTFCANRMRRLERCKKAKSFCTLEDEYTGLRTPSASNCRNQTDGISHCNHCIFSLNNSLLHAAQPNWQTESEQLEAMNRADDIENINAPTKFELLRQSLNLRVNMMNMNYQELALFLSTNDYFINLVLKLKISLMENDVRLLQQLLALGDSIQELKRKAQSGSQSSLNSSDCDEELCLEEKSSPFNSQSSDSTNLFLDDVEDDQPNADLYFSRKHSILRIPIAPRNSNRKCSLQKIARKASELRSSHFHSTLDESKRNLITRNVPVSVFPLPSKCNSSFVRTSTGSIDSGIRDAESSSPTCSTPSPTFKDQKF